MAHSSKIFDSQPITVQNLNGFDLSHLNCGTSKCGQLVPVLRKLLMQGSKISVGAAVNVELPPLATNFFGKIDFCIELFFVPCAILYGGWRQFISNQVATMFPASQDDVLAVGGYALPLLDMSVVPFGGSYDYTAAAKKVFTLQQKNDGLSDYLGVRYEQQALSGSGTLHLNLLPYLAYHKVVDTFYRNTTVTKTWFAVNPNVGFGVSTDAVGHDFDDSMETPSSNSIMGVLPNKNVSLVWHSFYTREPAFKEDDNVGEAEVLSSNNIFGTINLADITFPDGVTVLETRQRCYSRDYFTACSLDTQQGSPATLQMDVDLVDGTTELTVKSLRSIVALQRFEEKLNYDPSYRGIMRNLFGTTPKDALLDEPAYIGRLVLPVYQKSVYQQVNIGSGTSSNPFVGAGDLGAKGAAGSFSGEGSFCKGYKIGSFGYLMALASLVPHAMYGYGIDREMLANDIGDFPFPDLQTVGMDEVFVAEIYADVQYNRLKKTFGYLPRYSYVKYIDDSVHGELRPNRALESFALQRFFSQEPELSTDFVTIAQSDLDGVFATSVSVSNFSCWYEIFWEFKAAMPLAAFCIPTLGELHDVHTINTTQGGSRL